MENSKDETYDNLYENYYRRKPKAVDPVQRYNKRTIFYIRYYKQDFSLLYENHPTLVAGCFLENGNLCTKTLSDCFINNAIGHYSIVRSNKGGWIINLLMLQ